MSWIIREDSGFYRVRPDSGGDSLPCRDLEHAEARCNYLNGGDGLTKRERFAMAAMQQCQANTREGLEAFKKTASAGGLDDVTNLITKYAEELPAHIAVAAVNQADALIAELEKES